MVGEPQGKTPRERNYPRAYPHAYLTCACLLARFHLLHSQSCYEGLQELKQKESNHNLLN